MRRNVSNLLIFNLLEDYSNNSTSATINNISETNYNAPLQWHHVLHALTVSKSYQDVLTTSNKI